MRMVATTDSNYSVIPGLVPGIHRKKHFTEEDGLPGQARQ